MLSAWRRHYKRTSQHPSVYFRAALEYHEGGRIDGVTAMSWLDWLQQLPWWEQVILAFWLVAASSLCEPAADAPFETRRNARMMPVCAFSAL
jgi:hypothetical protein